MLHVFAYKSQKSLYKSGEKTLNIRYLIHKGLALILTLVISYVPIILSSTSLEIKNVLENSEIIFSLIALLAICMFDVLEANFKDTTLILCSFVIWFIIIIIGMVVYIYQSRTPDNTYWKTNLTCIIASIIMYFIYYGAIALNKKGTSNNG